LPLLLALLLLLRVCSGAGKAYPDGAMPRLALAAQVLLLLLLLLCLVLFTLMLLLVLLLIPLLLALLLALPGCIMSLPDPPELCKVGMQSHLRVMLLLRLLPSRLPLLLLLLPLLPVLLLLVTAVEGV
jgi:hypothetical protein